MTSGVYETSSVSRRVDELCDFVMNVLCYFATFQCFYAESIRLQDNLISMETKGREQTEELLKTLRERGFTYRFSE